MSFLTNIIKEFKAAGYEKTAKELLEFYEHYNKYKDCDSEEGQEDLKLASVRGLLNFMQNYSGLREPDMLSMWQNGNLCVEWRIYDEDGGVSKYSALIEPFDENTCCFAFIGPEDTLGANNGTDSRARRNGRGTIIEVIKMLQESKFSTWI